MRLIRTEMAIEQIEALPEDLLDSPIQSYIAQFSAIQFCAEMQQELRKIVIQSAEDHFPLAKNLSESACDKMLRSVKKSEISGFLGNFSDNLKDIFNEHITDQIESRYNKVVLARHKIAHGSIGDITPRDVLLGMEAATKILEAFTLALNAIHEVGRENETPARPNA